MANIKSIVNDVIHKYKTSNPDLIAKAMGIQVLYADLGKTLGYYTKYKKGKFIVLNSTMSGSAKNFVLAHELGHFIMHPDVSTPLLSKYSLYSNIKIEVEANTFAVELLLPDTYLEEHTDIGVYNLARCRGVPEGLVCLKSK